MTTMMPVELTCPVCGHKVKARRIDSTNTFGPVTTDLYRMAAGMPSMPFAVSGCEECGFSGFMEDFESGPASPELADWVRANLEPPGNSAETYENTARIAEHKGEPPFRVAHLWHRAGWCSGNRVGAGARYRREAATRFAALMERGEIAEGERAVITYLIGELFRRVGETGKAREWFARVPDAAAGDENAKRYVELAIQQSTNPREYIEG